MKVDGRERKRDKRVVWAGIGRIPKYLKGFVKSKQERGRE